MDAGYIAAITGLLGAAIGSGASIATILIQSKIKDKRDRSKQITDIAIAQFKMHLDLATSGRGPGAVLPISTFMYNTSMMLEALEDGGLTPDRLRQIALKNDEMEAAVVEIEKSREKPKP